MTAVCPLPCLSDRFLLSDNLFPDTVIRVKASREVILSAGTFNTPHILLNSGVGDASTLRAMKITPIKDLPGVGRNLSDHPALIGSWERPNATDTLESLASAQAASEALEQWTSSRSGPYSDGLTNNIGFFRLNESLPDVKSIFDTYGDLSPGPQSPHIQLFPLVKIFS